MPKLSDSQVKALHSRNKKNFSKVNPGESIYFRQAGQVVLIGDGHDPEVVNLVETSNPRKLGHVKLIRAAKGKDKGEVQVSGASGRREFEVEFELIMEGATMTHTQWQAGRV